MEVLVVVLGALETKAVDLGVKALAGWEAVLEEDMETILETWVVGLGVALVAVLFFLFPTSLRSWPM